MSTMPTPLDVLRDVFGFEAFRDPQEPIIADVLSGRDVFVLMPTGGGKSLCYQVPSLVKDGTAIVVSPLISLMKDQVDALAANGVRASCLNSSQSGKEQAQTLQSLHNGELDLLYVAPERAMSDDFLERIQSLKLSLVAIDEAHCVSKWGHDFRPEYVQLGALRTMLPGVPFVALTATADEHTRQDILQRLKLKDPAVYVAGFDRPNIRYTVQFKNQPMQQLLTFLRDKEGQAGIVYCLSRKRVEKVAEDLREAGYKAEAYHAGLPSADRAKVQEDFRRDDTNIVVATVAFGMGIDKPNVRFVVHYDLPKNVEAYYQETGRAGRDGLPSEALLLYGPGDISIARGLIMEMQNPTQKAIELDKLKGIVSYAEALSCRRQYLVGYFGEDHAGDCGNCDNCIAPVDTYDATEDAKAVMMAIYQTGQRFGMRHIVEVLRGAEGERLMRFGHHLLTAYGTGKHRKQEEWDGIVRQLIQQGYLKQDEGQYPILKLTPLTRPILREGATVSLLQPRVRPRRERRSKKVTLKELTFEQALFEKLRYLRRRLADEQGVPPYVVFGDQTLMEMAAHRPQTEEELLQISGVGKFKLDKYGPAFLSVLTAA